MNGGTPWGVRFDPIRNRTFVADGTNGVVYVLAGPAVSTSSPGPCTLLDTLQVGVPNKPHELAVDLMNGYMYVAGVGVPATLQRWIPASSE